MIHNLDRLAMAWPRLNLVQLRIIAAVYEQQGQTMTELALNLDIRLATVQFECRTLCDGQRGRPGHHLLAIFKGADSRTRQVFLAPRGLQIARLIEPLTEHEAPPWTAENQPELFTQGQRA